jgi:hypothetical protein
VYTSIILLQFVKHGFQLQPNFDVAVTKIALNPFQSFTDLPPGAQYVTSSWFMPAVLYFLRVSSETAMIWFHIAVALGYYVVTYLNVKRFVPDDSRLTAIVIIGLLPSTASAFNWLGYDTVILLLISLLIAASHSLILSFFVAIALGMQHFEIAVVSMLCWLIVSRGIATQSHLRTITFIVAAGLGLAMGRITVAVILASDTSASTSDRLDIAQQIYRKALANFAVAPMAVLWSTIGVTSIYLIITLASRKVTPLWILSGIIIPWIAAGTTLDSSRVGAVSVTLAIMATVFSSPHTLRAVPRYALFTMVVLFLIIPRVWIWEGAYEPSCFTANVHALISQFRPNGLLIESDCRLFWTDS